MTIGATDDAVVLADFTERPMMPAQLAVGPTPDRADRRGRLAAAATASERQLGEYFAASARGRSTCRSTTPGSAFQERVWAELRRIPYGETIATGSWPSASDAPGAPRAVGRANGSNRLAVIIPCHRVIAAGGGLGGYGGGLPAKRFLLDLERETRCSCVSHCRLKSAPRAW